MINNKILVITAFLLLVSGLAYSFVLKPSAERYVTWESLEPDKWASIWLIKRHINSGADIEVRPRGDSLAGGITFGVPDGDYQRSGNRSTFEALLLGFDTENPTLSRLGKIITAIETTAWNTAADPLASIVEASFRQLQDRYGRRYVPISCYAHFFDEAYQSLEDGASPEGLAEQLTVAVNNSQCTEQLDIANRASQKTVSKLPINVLLDEISANKKVVFVDTREPEEYNKAHIPGAINIPMRDLNEDAYAMLRDADRVISYCIKDFRGYEVARKLLENGVKHVAIMEPYGLAGWQASGLPLASSDQVVSEQAQKKLQQCAIDPSSCLK